MKRIQSACICQTLHFQQKEGADHKSVVRNVQEEVAHYKQQMDRSGTIYKILQETQQPDGSVVIKLVKQYNQSPVGDYLN